MTKIEEFAYSLFDVYNKMKWIKQSANLLNRYISEFGNYEVEIFYNTYENFYGIILHSSDNGQYSFLKSYEDGGNVVEKLFHLVDKAYNSNLDFIDDAIKQLKMS